MKEMRAMHNSPALMRVLCASFIFGSTLAGGALAENMSADVRTANSRYREAVNSANATYKADLLQCSGMSGEERANCRRDAAASRREALSAARAQRASPSKPVKSNPDVPTDTTGIKGALDPKLQRESPPDIIEPRKK